MRSFIVVALLLTLAIPARAEPPTEYLHCTGRTTSGTETDHVVVLHSNSAQVDEEKYDFGEDDAQYDLLGKTIGSELFGGPLTLIVIDRVTGDYKTSQGTTQTESGHCVKVQRQL